MTDRGIVPVEEHTPLPVAQLDGPISRADDVGEQHGCEHAVGVDLDRGAGERELDLAEQRLFVAGVVQVVVTRKLDEARVRNALREITPVPDFDQAVTGPMNHRRRRAYARQDRPQIDLHEQPLHRGRHSRAGREALEPGVKLPFAGHARQARRTDFEGRAGPPRVARPLHGVVDQRGVDTKGIVGGPREPGRAVAQHESMHAIGMGCRIEHRHRASGAGADQRRALRTGGVEYRGDVVHPRIEQAFVVGSEGVRQPDAPLVEQQQATERREALEKCGAAWLVPLRFEMCRPLRSEEHVDRAFPHDLICDMILTNAGIRSAGSHARQVASHGERRQPETPHPAYERQRSCG